MASSDSHDVLMARNNLAELLLARETNIIEWFKTGIEWRMMLKDYCWPFRLCIQFRREPIKTLRTELTTGLARNIGIERKQPHPFKVYRILNKIFHLMLALRAKLAAQFDSIVMIAGN